MLSTDKTGNEYCFHYWFTHKPLKCIELIVFSGSCNIDLHVFVLIRSGNNSSKVELGTILINVIVRSYLLESNKIPDFYSE